MRVLFLIILVWSFSGCSLTREVPAPVTYRLDPPDKSKASAERGCRDRVIRIALVQSPGLLRSDSIHYSDTHAKRYRYISARWEETPAEQWQQIIESAVTENGLFRGVIPYKSLAKDDWLLEVRVDAMDQQIADDGSSTTESKLYAVIIDRYSREVLAEKRFHYSDQSQVSDVMSAVSSWSQAAGKFEQELTVWLEEECRSQSPIDRDGVDR